MKQISYQFGFVLNPNMDCSHGQGSKTVLKITESKCSVLSTLWQHCYLWATTCPSDRSGSVISLGSILPLLQGDGGTAFTQSVSYSGTRVFFLLLWQTAVPEQHNMQPLGALPECYHWPQRSRSSAKKLHLTPGAWHTGVNVGWWWVVSQKGTCRDVVSSRESAEAEA